MKNTIVSALLIIALSVTAVLAAVPPTRIRIARGKTSVTLRGVVGKRGTTEYVVGVKKSQTMDVKVVSSCGNKVSLDVLYRETGESIVDEASDNFHNTLPSAGDYLVRVRNSSATVCKYKLKVGIE